MMRRKLLGTVVVLSLVPSFFFAVVAAQPPAKPKAAPKKPAVPSKPPPKTAAPPPPPAPTPPPPPTDVQLRTKYTTGAQVSENRTYIQGPRQRFEFPGLTMITQCDQKRTFQIHEGTKRYMVTPTADLRGCRHCTDRADSPTRWRPLPLQRACAIRREAERRRDHQNDNAHRYR